MDAARPTLSPNFPAVLTREGLEPITAEFFDYYVTDRVHHPRSDGGLTLTSDLAHINTGAVAHLGDIALHRCWSSPVSRPTRLVQR